MAKSPFSGKLKPSPNWKGPNETFAYLRSSGKIGFTILFFLGAKSSLRSKAAFISVAGTIEPRALPPIAGNIILRLFTAGSFFVSPRRWSQTGKTYRPWTLFKCRFDLGAVFLDCGLGVFSEESQLFRFSFFKRTENKDLK